MGSYSDRIKCEHGLIMDVEFKYIINWHSTSISQIVRATQGIYHKLKCKRISR